MHGDYVDLEDYDDGTPVYDFVKWFLNGIFIVAGPAVICWLCYVIGKVY